VSSDQTAAPAMSTNVAGIDLAMLVDQLTRTGSSPEMTATILSTLVATSPDAGPDEQKQILQKLTEALRERQRQIELQKLAAISGSGVTSSSAITAAVTTSSQSSVSISTVPSQVSTLPSTVTAASIVKHDEHKPVSTVTKESTTKPSEPVLPKAASIVTTPAPSVTASLISEAPISTTVPSTQQWVSSILGSSAVTFSSINASVSSALPVTLATASTAVIHPPATSALPPAIQQMLSGQSFENLKNILANVTGRKTGGIGVQDQSVTGTGSAARPHETLDSYTTSKGSRSDLQKMMPESEMQSKKSAEQDELFVANVHGDVDYRMRPAVSTSSDPPKNIQPFPIRPSGWTGGGDQLPLPASPTVLQPEGPYVGVAGPRLLLPSPFLQNSSCESKSSSGVPLLPALPHTGKPQALLPTPEASKPSGKRQERGRENREGRQQKSEDVEGNRDRPRYKDRRPFDDRSLTRDDRRRRSSRERVDVDNRSERRGRSRSSDRSITRKPSSSSRGDAERSANQTSHSEEGPIVIDDDCEDIPLPPATAASKTSHTNAPPSETSTSKKQNFDADRKVLLPTPDNKVSTEEKRKSDESRREEKFSRSWEHRRSLKRSPSSSKIVSETKGKKALLETPVTSSSSESVRAANLAGDSYHRDAKDSRTDKHDSDSKSYERRRSRSKSRTKHIASNLLDRSRRKLGLLRRHRSSSRDRRRSSPSSSRDAVAHDARRRSQSKERPAERSASRDRLEAEERRLRKQLDDLMARKNEENRSKEHQFSPSLGQDQRREQVSEIPSLFDVIPNYDASNFDARARADRPLDARAHADRPFQRRHLLPAPPHLLSTNMKGRALLELPTVPRPPDAESGLVRQNVDINLGTHYGQSVEQPLLPSTVLPGRPFVQEYSHKPPETHVDQFMFREVVDHNHSPKDCEPGRPTVHEELGQRRYRPYPKPEDHRRIPPESTERPRNWHARDRKNEETGMSSKTSESTERGRNWQARDWKNEEKDMTSKTSESTERGRNWQATGRKSEEIDMFSKTSESTGRGQSWQARDRKNEETDTSSKTSESTKRGRNWQARDRKNEEISMSSKTSESTERGRNWQARDRKNEETDTSSKTSESTERPRNWQARGWKNEETEMFSKTSESTRRGQSWQARDRKHEETDVSSKTSDLSGVTTLDRTPAGLDKVALSQASITEHCSPSFSAVDQNSTMCQSAATTPSAAVYTPAKPELPVTGDGLLPNSSAPGILPTGGTFVDKPVEQTPDTTTTAANEPAPAMPSVLPPRPTPPIPPHFPAFLQHVRNMMFPRIPARVPFSSLPGPRVHGMFRPPLGSFPVAPVSAPSVQQGPTMMNRASMPLAGQSCEAAAPSKKPLLGDYPAEKQTPPLIVEGTANINSNKDTGPESAQHQSEDIQNTEQACDQARASHHMAPPRLLELGDTQIMPDSQFPLDSVTGEEADEDLLQAGDFSEQEESSEIPPLMDFTVFRHDPSSQGPVPLRLGPPLMRGLLPNVRSPMPLLRHSMPHGLRVPRPMPPIWQAVMEMRASGGPPFPRRGGASFPPRARYPQ